MSESSPKQLLPQLLSRRTALKVIVGSAGAASLPVLNHAQPGVGASLAAYVPRFFNAQQIRTIDALSEAIIPRDEHSPGASAARVFAYIDILVGDSDHQRKRFWTQSLAVIDQMAESGYGRKYADCTPEQQNALLQQLSDKEENPKALEEQFFVAVKQATIDGYYTSEIGIHRELGYQGNTALAEFEGCTHEEHRKP